MLTSSPSLEEVLTRFGPDDLLVQARDSLGKLRANQEANVDARRTQLSLLMLCIRTSDTDILEEIGSSPEELNELHKTTTA